MTWISRAALARGDLCQDKKSTEVNEGNKGFLLRNPNWIFVFFVAFCKNPFATAKAMRGRIALQKHFPHTAGRQCEIDGRDYGLGGGVG